MKASKINALKLIIILIFFTVQYPLNNYAQKYILGGNMGWHVIDTTTYDSTIITYLVTLKLFTQYPQFLPDSVMITVWDLDTDSIWTIRMQPREGIFDMPETTFPCATSPPLNIKFARYSPTFDFPLNVKGYYAAWQGYCN